MVEIYRVIDKRPNGGTQDCVNRTGADVVMRNLCASGAKPEDIALDIIPSEDKSKTRKPRSDRGLPRKTTPSPQKRVRSRGVYFVIEGGEILAGSTMEDLKTMLEHSDAGMEPRIIQGRELKAERKVEYKFKSV